MEIKKPTIKSIPYEDFKDNEYLENMVKQLNEGGTKVLVGCLDDLIGVCGAMEEMWQGGQGERGALWSSWIIWEFSE